MSKKSKAASSSRAQVGAFGSSAFGGASTSTFGTSFASGAPPSQLSYVYEPPDLSAISDPSTVVAWKNLQKRDSITKTKALDELLAHVGKIEEDKQALDDGFLEAWVRYRSFFRSLLGHSAVFVLRQTSCKFVIGHIVMNFLRTDQALCPRLYR